MTDVFVSVGGSGSKVLEALVFLCAAGLGPDRLRVLCIESESENGNFRRAEAALATYQRLHAALRVGGNAVANRSGLFKTQISTLLPNTLRWSPLGDDANRNLAAVFNKPGMTEQEERALFDSLFTFTEAPNTAQPEQFTSLANGFRGRPPMGVAALANAELDTTSMLFREIQLLVEQSEEQTPPKVFIAGSVFGGTGASLMPALARFIREYQGRMPIGAAFLLPYFGFRSPDPNVLAAKSTEFLRNTRRILNYYAVSLREKTIFDSVYVLGAPRLAIVPGESALGGPAQRNPPLLVEMFAAIAACRFLSPRDRTGDQPLYAVRVGDDAVSWSDFPPVTEGSAANPMTTALGAVGNLVRFCWAFSVVYAREFRSNAEALNAQQPWYRNWLSSQGVNFATRAGEYTPICEALDRFCLSLLSWFATIALPPAGPQGIENALPCRFTDAQSLRSQIIGENGYAAIDLNAAPLGDFSNLIHGAVPKSLADVFYQLNGTQPVRGESGVGLGAFITALHEACSTRPAAVQR